MPEMSLTAFRSPNQKLTLVANAYQDTVIIIHKLAVNNNEI